MALPDKFKTALGTPVIWGEAGATGISLTVTKTLSLDALASAGGRMGASADLGALWDRDQLVQLIVETGTAPVAGVIAELYLAWSHDNINWPGKVTGSDAAYPATIADNKKQLGNPVVILVATADTNTVLNQNPVRIRALARYVTPVVVNLLGQAFRDEATATNNDSRVVLTPLIASIED
jgi:hypothetical protein